jgi:hypothetical protein
MLPLAPLSGCWFCQQFRLWAVNGDSLLAADLKQTAKTSTHTHPPTAPKEKHFVLQRNDSQLKRLELEEVLVPSWEPAEKVSGF